MEGRNLEYLDAVKAVEWLYNRPIVKLNDTDTADLALEYMHDAHSSCALVYQKNGPLLGMLDLLDVVRYALRGCIANGIPVGRLLRLCAVGTHSVSLGDICRHMRLGSRRVVLACDTGEHTIVSQRSLAQALYEMSSTTPELLALLNTTIDSLNLASFENLIVASDSWTAKEAFQKMATYDITSLPVCDIQGRAVGVISATDVLYARHDWNRLEQPVLGFVASSRRDAANLQAVNSVISCRQDATLGDALSVMLHNNIHHVYVLDEGTLAPVGVVAFVDVIRQV